MIWQSPGNGWGRAAFPALPVASGGLGGLEALAL